MRHTSEVISVTSMTVSVCEGEQSFGSSSKHAHSLVHVNNTATTQTRQHIQPFDITCILLLFILRIQRICIFYLMTNIICISCRKIH